jgi:hypothetical protein
LRLAVAISAACFFRHLVRRFWNHTWNKHGNSYIRVTERRSRMDGMPASYCRSPLFKAGARDTLSLLFFLSPFVSTMAWAVSCRVFTPEIWVRSCASLWLNDRGTDSSPNVFTFSCQYYSPVLHSRIHSSTTDAII